MKTWGEALQDALVSGAIAGAATTIAAAWCGARDSGSAVAPINATAHIAFGDEAASVDGADMKHTGLGFLLNAGAAVMWATLYEKAFGAAAERGEVTKAFSGGKAIAGLAYLTDYHAVPKRFTPGWELRVSDRSLMIIYTALALSLPLRGLMRGRGRGRDSGVEAVEA